MRKANIDRNLGYIHSEIKLAKLNDDQLNKQGNLEGSIYDEIDDANLYNKDNISSTFDLHHICKENKMLKEENQKLKNEISLLSIQLITYKEDFNMERKDREKAHERIINLEEEIKSLNEKLFKLDSGINYSNYLEIQDTSNDTQLKPIEMNLMHPSSNLEISNDGKSKPFYQFFRGKISQTDNSNVTDLSIPTKLNNNIIGMNVVDESLNVYEKNNKNNATIPLSNKNYFEHFNIKNQSIPSTNCTYTFSNVFSNRNIKNSNVQLSDKQLKDASSWSCNLVDENKYQKNLENISKSRQNNFKTDIIQLPNAKTNTNNNHKDNSIYKLTENSLKNDLDLDSYIKNNFVFVSKKKNYNNPPDINPNNKLKIENFKPGLQKDINSEFNKKKGNNIFNLLDKLNGSKKIVDSLEDTLKCPKCRRTFTIDEHLLLLDHLDTGC